MKLREVTIRNFRCLVNTTIPIDDTTVLIGENNSGKTAFLDALRIVLSRTGSWRGSIFDEYDYHMCKREDSPQTCEGIVIELWLREDSPDEWPVSLGQALDDIILTDPTTDLDSIGLRLSSKYDDTAGRMSTVWQFLTLDGQPITRGRGARPAMLTNFIPYIRLFYLSALRDASDEFAPRSQFWGRILRDLKIGDEQRKSLTDELEKLNAELLKADPRLEQVVKSLGEVQSIMGLGAGQNTSIQALPMRPWDLMSKSQVVIKAPGNDVDFPLSRYGQGMQSMAVIFLFQAYIKALLKPAFRPETEAILALEEPETHLHPQAARALAANLDVIGGQKIISSHSPFFIQEIPLERIRMFRRDGPLSKVVYIKRSFNTIIPTVEELTEFCTNNSAKYSYHTGTSTLSLSGIMEEREYRALLQIYPHQNDTHKKLRQLRDESQFYLSGDDLISLDTYVKRVRGEILFARAWLLCEGQCEYLLFRYFAELLKQPLDRAGVAVIDFQNNGSPSAFIGLARAFEMPWIMICDNDSGGDDFLKQMENHGLTEEERTNLFRPLPGDDVKLEKYLVNNGFAEEYRQILEDNKVPLTKKQGETGFEDEIIALINGKKIGYTTMLIEKLRIARADESRVPDFVKLAITDIIAKAGS